MPATPSVSLSVLSSTTVLVSATAGADTTHIQFDRSWVANSGTNDLEVACSTGNTTNQYFAMPTAPGSYVVLVRARIGSTASSWVSRGFTVEEPPDPDPSITALSLSGTGTIEASWNVANASYMRPGNSMAIYMSGPNNSTQHFQGYLQSHERSWSKGLDGAGNALVAGATYTIWIAVYNSDGGSFTASRSVIFSRPRPTNFNWDNAKTQSGQYNLTVTEWRGLLDTINLFRAYKGLAVSTFNHTISGSGATSYIVPSANSYNAARNSTSDMNSSAPGSVFSNGIITAAELNDLRTALNNIT